MATRADARYQPPYQYQCAQGHEIAAEAPTGTLTRVGPGSRTHQETTR